MKYIVFVLSLLVGSSAIAQTEKPEQTKTRKPARERMALPDGVEPGRTMKPSRGMGKLAASYPDSNEFNKAFAELFTIIKPEVTVQQRTEKLFMQSVRTFARTGVDSAKAYEAVMKSVDPKMDYDLIYMTYRSQLNAEELRGWVNFLKTPAGKKILEVGDRLLAADDKLIESQLRRTVNMAIAPLRQPRQPKAQQVNGTSQVAPLDGMSPAHGASATSGANATSGASATGGAGVQNDAPAQDRK